MDFSKTLDLIVRDLEEALEIIDDFRNYPDVPAIQVELAKAKCRNAAEVIALLKPEVGRRKTVEESRKTEVESTKPGDGRRMTEDGRPKIDERSLRSTATKSRERSESGEEPERSGARRSQIPLSGTGNEETYETIHQSGILADTFGASPDSLNEKLGSLRADENVPDYLRGKPLTSLKEAIGINDRFLFIRELFEGNAESYSLAITKLDEASCLSDARAMLTDFTQGKAECEAAKQLLDLVKRKYPGNE